MSGPGVMSASVVRERSGQAHRAGGPAFDLVVSKLRRSAPRPGTVRRAVLERLARDDLRPIVSVAAPAGYGKTTLLSQWAERDGRSFAWVSVDDKDNDPKVLLTYVAQALDEVEPVGQRVFDALASPASSVPGSVVPRLGAAFASMTSPVVLVLDDVHLLLSPECRAALSVLAEHIPAGSRLVLAGRDEPPLRVARLRAEGRITEVGPADLALTRGEAAALLRAAGVTLGADEVAVLHERTEGWPVGLYLAALYLREGGSVPGAADSFGGGDRFVNEYVESEFLARISPEQREFLTRTAVLDRMSGPLCEAVLGIAGAGAILADLARSNLLLVPLDRRGQWYRYHHLFRDMLLAELERREPALILLLRRRAAGWCLDNGRTEEALEYSIAAGDVETVARLAGDLWLPTFRQGQYATLRRWFLWLEDHGGSGRYPAIAAAAAITAGYVGRPEEAERWAEVVDRWQYGDGPRPDNPAAEGWAAMLRACLCRHGIAQMHADADEAVQKLMAANIPTSSAAVCQGIARVLSGDLDGGDWWFQETFRIATENSGHQNQADALAWRAVVAIARGEWSRAEALAGQAGTVLRQAGMEEGYASSPLVCAVQARVAMHRGDVLAARQELVRAQRERHLLTYANPHFAVQARIELIRVHLALADLAGARTLMREVDELLKRRPDLGTLVGEAAALRAQLARHRGTVSAGASALTAAELRLLPLLSTHLSFAGIGAELFVSPNTAKTHAVSIYRKLGADSRGQAVARARQLGLLEG
jgi:LuxR family transcriptional regulator, maltose regulon positive regulatory protein